MRVKRVICTTELITEMFTLGWCVGLDCRVECTQGLPSGSKLIKVRDLPEEYRFECLFEHESFEDVDPGCIPVLKVLHARIEHEDAMSM